MTDQGTSQDVQLSEKAEAIGGRFPEDGGVVGSACERENHHVATEKSWKKHEKIKGNPHFATAEQVDHGEIEEKNTTLVEK